MKARQASNPTSRTSTNIRSVRRPSPSRASRASRQPSIRFSTDTGRTPAPAPAPASENVQQDNVETPKSKNCVDNLSLERHFAFMASWAVFLAIILACSIVAPLFLLNFFFESEGRLAEIKRNQKMNEQWSMETMWTPCDEETNENRARCHYRGVCLKNSLTGQKKCDCDSGAHGPRCEKGKEPGACSVGHDHCVNGGVCREGVGNYLFCECPLGFEGRKCEKKLTPCSPNPCENGGTCHDRKWTFTCECPIDKAGAHCERNSTLCPTEGDLPNACAHNANCTNILGGLTLTCSGCREKSDELCAESIAYLNSSQCNQKTELLYLFGSNEADDGRCFKKNIKLLIGEK